MTESFNWGRRIGDIWFAIVPRAVRLGHIAWCQSVWAKAKEERCVVVELACDEDLMQKIIDITSAEYYQTINDPLEHRRLFVVRKTLPPPERTKQQIADTYVGMPKANDPAVRLSRTPLPQYGPPRNDLEW